MRFRSLSWFRCVPFGLLLLLPLLATGCGVGPPVPVSGKVTIDNKPLTTGLVTYRPDRNKGNNAIAEPHGTIGDDGTYTLETDGKPGAPPGAYKVVVTAMAKPKDPKDIYAIGASLVNKKYTNEATTPFDVTVTANAPAGTYDLKLVP